MINKTLSTLQAACFRSDVSAVQVMRAAVMVAATVDDAGAVATFRKELNGYETGDALPNFRQAHARLMGVDRWGRRVPVFMQDAMELDKVTTVPLVHGLVAINSLMAGAKDGSEFEMEFGPDFHQRLLEVLPDLLRVMRVVQAGQFRAVLDEARQRVFDWCTDKLVQGVSCPDVNLGGLLPPPPESAERVQPVVAPAGLHVTASNSSVVIQSPSAVSSVTQGSQVEPTALKALVEMLEAVLSKVNPAEVDKQVKDLEASLAELKALSQMPKPKADWARESMKSVRNVLENATGGLLTALASQPALMGSVQQLLS